MVGLARGVALLLLALACAAALADDAVDTDDADALLLADTSAQAVAVASDWHWFSEVAAGQSASPAGVLTPEQRLSFDLRVDTALAPHWRAVLANRLDLSWPAPHGDEHSVNTLKEAYLSWQASDNDLLDMGRINVRHGVATGYNPTDYFRAGASRSVVSVDPSSLKKNRQGSVMVRGQTLWNGGSLTGQLSPKLAEHASDAPFSPDLGATNAQNRWLLVLGQQWTDTISPQWLLYGQDQQAPQLGMNLSALLGDSTVAYVEWSGGRSRSQLAQALRSADDASFHNRASTGVTYTAGNKLSLTLEYAYNNAALSSDSWSALQRGAPLAYGAYRSWAQTAQELPTQEMAGLYLNWPDAITQHLDLSAMLRVNLADTSRLRWLEARYHWSRTDLALQWQLTSGAARSDYGAAAQQRAWQVSLRQYF